MDKLTQIKHEVNNLSNRIEAESTLIQLILEYIMKKGLSYENSN